MWTGRGPSGTVLPVLVSMSLQTSHSCATCSISGVSVYHLCYQQPTHFLNLPLYKRKPCITTKMERWQTMGKKEGKVQTGSQVTGFRSHSLFPAQQPDGDSNMFSEMTSTSTSNPAVTTHVSHLLLPCPMSAGMPASHLGFCLRPPAIWVPGTSMDARHASATDPLRWLFPLQTSFLTLAPLAVWLILCRGSCPACIVGCLPPLPCRSQQHPNIHTVVTTKMSLDVGKKSPEY